MRIGELLVMNGLITEETLKNALKLQVSSNKKLGEILIDSGEITERQLMEVLEFQLGIPVIHLNETVFKKTIVHLIHESTARKYNIIPIDQKGGKIKIAMVDPLNLEAIKQIQLETGLNVQPLLAARSELEQAISQHFGVTETVEELNQIIQSAVEQNAKNIQFIPEENELLVKFYILNALQKHKVILINKGALINRIKIMSNLNTEERRLPQEGRLQWKLENKQIDLRVSTLPTVNGESILIRIINPSEEVLKITDLGFSEDNYHKLENLIQYPSGMILVSGPSNSGKSSTLYSILNELNNDELNIISVEDSVERHMKGITQVEVNNRIGFTLIDALQSVLFRNPDIVLIGNLCDKETIDIAAKASLSGCRTLSGSQGNNVGDTIRRLLDLGVDSHLIALSLSGIIVQRLVRCVCKNCTYSVIASDEETKIFENYNLLDLNKDNKSHIRNFRAFVTAQISGKITLTRGKGCHVCSNTGYYGKLALHEVLHIDKRMKELIVKSLPNLELEQYLKEKEYKTILYDGLLKAREGKTTVEEVMKVVE
jgi:type IV pilus assembly protein PilB